MRGAGTRCTSTGQRAAAGHERRPVLVRGDHPRPGAARRRARRRTGRRRCAPVPAGRARASVAIRGRDERVGVDLPVRVVQGDADLLAAVLEAEDLLHAGGGRELRGAVGPGLDHRAHRGRQPARRSAVVVAGEADDLAPARPGPQLGQRRAGAALGGTSRSTPVAKRREAVLEHDDVVVGGRDLGRPVRPRTGTAGTRRPAAGTCGSAGATAIATHSPSSGVVAQLRRAVATGGRSRVSAASCGRRRRLVVEVDDLAAVGQVTTGPDHRGCASRTGQAAHHCR